MIRTRLFLPLIVLLSFSSIPVFADTGTISVDYGKLYEINYDAKGVTVLDVTPNPDDVELIFSVHVDTPAAALTLTIPRELLDATEGGEDTNFFVIADGDLVNFSEKKSTETTRTLFIQLTQSMSELEIFGTHLTGKTFENVPAPESETQTPQPEAETPSPEQPSTPTEQPKQEEMTPPSEEEKPTESLGEKPAEEPTQTTTENEPSVPQKTFDFNFPNWSIRVTERQMTEFVMAAGVFVAFAIALAAIKGARTAKSLP